ncbi:putative HTH transcriptional regulator, lambda repressor-like, DNA-binding protein [Gottschalkia acidurici 9a]|uniref:HTH transcriptional regulator, lambda repressor-like, DNA-binding protein n=1 Tax=Gottschalkia acidurici (strain ATCC 7906 / DSM 604 / BCRC 14475 / CIP 104303 / KCTC 5404 / NCIMB 10678 / 9a) TaxID=1128398 RepID=K0B1D2_GOTA9|nr:helix-turn-helix domain-containing protein [Gottschalkia acidurici]AFS79813.1 putative HTH transcriptional regulator, lambda repressor-like, DNA-binding protein [Gottschalkia acidurici 9a]
MIGKRIKELRVDYGLSLKQLSERIDISISFLSDIENNRSNPSLDRLKDIAKGLNTTVSYLIGESENSFVLKDTLLNDDEIQKILKELSCLDYWSSEDKKELLYYLRAKNFIVKSNNRK